MNAASPRALDRRRRAQRLCRPWRALGEGLRFQGLKIQYTTHSAAPMISAMKA